MPGSTSAQCLRVLFHCRAKAILTCEGARLLLIQTLLRMDLRSHRHYNAQEQLTGATNLEQRFTIPSVQN